MQLFLRRNSAEFCNYSVFCMFMYSVIWQISTPYLRQPMSFCTQLKLSFHLRTKIKFSLSMEIGNAFRKLSPLVFKKYKDILVGDGWRLNLEHGCCPLAAAGEIRTIMSTSFTLIFWSNEIIDPIFYIHLIIIFRPCFIHGKEKY